MRAYTKSRLWTPDTVSPIPFATTPKKGMELVDLRAFGIIPGIAGGDTLHGYHSSSDVITRTADGRDLNEIWNEFQTLLNAVNEERQALIRFLTYPVTQAVDTIVLPGDGVDFEEASEYGEPVGARLQPNTMELGFTFKWYDLAARYTWQYLADANAQMVSAVANASVEAFYRRQLFTVLRRVFNPTEESTKISGQPGAGSFPVFGFYNGDGQVPPAYKTNTFTGSHSHYKETAGATLVPADLDTLVIDDLAEHGYSMENGYRLVTMVHTALGNVIETFKRGEGGDAGPPEIPPARYDFIPATGRPGMIVDQTTQVIGQSQLGPSIDGLTVIGNYGPLTIVTDDWLPEDYVFTFATGGSENLSNPLGLREHNQSNLRGLRLVKGRTPDYPLIDSFWAVGFGTGVRHRGAGIVLEVSDAGDGYDTPSIYE